MYLDEVTNVKTALIIVDMTKAFVEPKTAEGDCALYMPLAKGLIPNINKVITELEPKDVIIHVTDCHEKEDKEFEKFPSHAIKGTEETQIADGFEYGGRRMRQIKKTRYSGFYKTDLQSKLNSLGIKRIIVVGVATDICILHTVADAVMRDYEVVVKRNCMTGIYPVHENIAIEHMQIVLGAKVE
jgi:nicotinamidase-related amidase